MGGGQRVTLLLGPSSGPLWSALHTASLLLGLPASSMLLRSFCQEKSSPDLQLTLSSPAQTLCGFRLPQDIQVLTSWTDLYACSHRLVYSFLHSVCTEHVRVPDPALRVLSRVRFFVIPWTVACQAAMSVRLPRQGYWSGLPFPTPGDHPNPGIKPVSLVSPALQAHSLPPETQGKPSPALEARQLVKPNREVPGLMELTL